MVAFAPEHPAPLNFFGFMIGSVFPDADIKYSKIGKFIPLWLFFNHRGFTHTIWGLLIFSGIVTLIFSLSSGIAFSLGYLLHLAMDSSTPMGIHWLRGHKKRHLRFR